MNTIKYIIAGLTLTSMLLTAKSQIIDEYDNICYYAMMSNNIPVVEQNVDKVISSNKRVEYYTWIFSTKNITKYYVISRVPSIVRNTEFNDEQWNKLTNILISRTEDNTGTAGLTETTLRFDYLLANKGKSSTANSQLYTNINTGIAMLLDGGLDKPIEDVNSAKKEIANKLTKQIKIYLRKNNKSFVSIVGPDGKVSVNPIADCSKPIIDALNAPQCIGLEAELRKIGFEVDDFDRTRLNALIPKHMDDIMYGEIPYSKSITGSILIYLGVDEYNAWVNEYNTGVSGRSSTDNLKKN